MPQRIFLVNVRSLCFNIPKNKGIKAVETTLKPKNIQTKVIISFLKLIITLNNFIFNNTNFLQIKGCAIGTKCALTHAKQRGYLKSPQRYMMELCCERANVFNP